MTDMYGSTGPRREVKFQVIAIILAAAGLAVALAHLLIYVLRGHQQQ